MGFDHKTRMVYGALWFTGLQILKRTVLWGSLQAYHLNSNRKCLDQETDTPASGLTDGLPGCFFSRRAIYLGHYFLV